LYYFFYKYFIFDKYKIKINKPTMGIGDWGLGIGDWGFGPIPKTPTPIPQ
jgi:hypothetical protein